MDIKGTPMREEDTKKSGENQAENCHPGNPTLPTASGVATAGGTTSPNMDVDDSPACFILAPRVISTKKKPAKQQGKNTTQQKRKNREKQRNNRSNKMNAPSTIVSPSDTPTTAATLALPATIHEDKTLADDPPAAASVTANDRMKGINVMVQKATTDLVLPLRPMVFLTPRHC
jgi:hypothetical protein